jgi:O-antigen/teichoic acid export membrane protein
MSSMNKRSDAIFLQIMGVIQNGSPIIIITSLINLTAVSVYSVYNMVAGTISTCIDVFTSGLAASFGTIKASGEEELLIKSNEQFRVSIFLFITILYSVMLVMLIPFVVLFTKDVTDTLYVIPAFSFFITLYGLINAARGPYGMLIFSFGKYKEIKPYTIYQTLIAVIGGVVFTKLWGITGIAAALCLSSLFMLSVMIWFTPKYLLPISVSREIGRIVRVFAVVLVIYLVSRLVDFNPHSYLSWLGYAACTTILSAAAAFGVNYPFEKAIYREVALRIKRYVGAKLMRRQVKMEM